MTTLVGKFVLVDSGDSFRTGQIVEAVEPTLYLVQFDAMSGSDVVFPLELVGTEELTSRLPDEHARWGFFSSREKLQEWIDWLESPSKPATVIRLVKKPIQEPSV